MLRPRIGSQGIAQRTRSLKDARRSRPADDRIRAHCEHFLCVSLACNTAGSGSPFSSAVRWIDGRRNSSGLVDVSVPVRAARRLAARGRSPVGRATRAYGAYARREEESMRDTVDDEQRRRRAVTPGRPLGWGGFGPAAALTLLNDDTASPASRRLAAHPKALPTRPAGLLPRAAKSRPV